MARTGRWISAVLLVFFVSFPSLPSLTRPDWLTRGNEAGRAWARGPVWYLMTVSEYAAYHRLRSEDERRTFIRTFWDRRDPLPETPENELEREFWRRVS